MFIEAQGYPVLENVLYQDNQSAIKIEKNGKRSSGPKTKHMDHRYFFIKDRISSEKIKIEYCPTEDMLADFFTKPLQGSLFRKFRDVVMGYAHIDTLKTKAEARAEQERVRNGVSDKDLNSPIGSATCTSVSVEGQDPTSVKSKDRTWADVVKMATGQTM